MVLVLRVASQRQSTDPVVEAFDHLQCLAPQLEASSAALRMNMTNLQNEFRSYIK